MTKQHKTGDIVGVRVVEDDGGSVVGGFGYFVPRTALVQLPAAMTPEERAVLDEADARVSSAGLEHQSIGAVRSRLAGFVMAIRASRQPADPMKELRIAVQELFAAQSRYYAPIATGAPLNEMQERLDAARARYNAALAAVEAALEKK